MGERGNGALMMAVIGVWMNEPVKGGIFRQCAAK